MVLTWSSCWYRRIMRGSVPMGISLRVDSPVPRRTGARECESTGGRFAAAALQSVISMPARSAAHKPTAAFSGGRLNCQTRAVCLTKRAVPVPAAGQALVLGAPDLRRQEPSARPAVDANASLPAVAQSHHFAVSRRCAGKDLETGGVTSCPSFLPSYWVPMQPLLFEASEKRRKRRGCTYG